MLYKLGSVRYIELGKEKLCILLLCFFTLSACGLNDGGISFTQLKQSSTSSLNFSQSKLEDLQNLLMKKKNVPTHSGDIIAGLNQFEKRNFVAANSHFEHALKFDPQNSILHKLNAVSYHKRGDLGDPDMFKLADVGYDLAGKFDAGDSSIAFFRGMLHYNQRNFKQAQEYLAQAISIDSRNHKFYLALAAASYYLGEVDRAYQNVKKAQEISPRNPDVIAVNSIVHASLGAFDRATQFTQNSFVNAGGDASRKSYLEARLSDWQNYYETNNLKVDGDFETILVQSDNGLFSVPTDSLLDDIDDLSTSGLNYDEDSEDDDKIEEENLDMALIDVSIISSEETYRSSKGVNLLDGLNLFYKVDSSQTGASSEQIGFGLSGDGLNYSLNIFSDANDKNEVLARPSIVVQHGKPSSFFSGNTMHIVLDGGTAGQGSIDQIEDGIRLDVLPKFLDKETITLEVMAERIGLTGALSSASAKENSPHFAKSSKTKIKGNLTLRFGETMILSGLSDQEKDFEDDKVPGLGDLPLVQYLFRNNVKAVTRKSILILLTPRRASLTDQRGDALVEKTKYTPNNLLDLERKASWMKPSANLTAIVKHLGKYKFFNQFRSGDIMLEKWAGEKTLDDILSRSVDYFFIKYG